MVKRTIRKRGKEITFIPVGDGKVEVHFSKGFSCPVFGNKIKKIGIDEYFTPQKGFNCYRCPWFIDTWLEDGGCQAVYQVIRENEIESFIKKIFEEEI